MTKSNISLDKFKKHLGKKVNAVIDLETKETIETIVKYHKESNLYITNCGYVIIDIIWINNM